MFKFPKLVKKFNVHFYMRGGHVVVARDVTKVEMTRDLSDGGYSGYTITWANPKKAKFFTLSIKDIVAVEEF